MMTQGPVGLTALPTRELVENTFPKQQSDKSKFTVSFINQDSIYLTHLRRQAVVEKNTLWVRDMALNFNSFPYYLFDLDGMNVFLF